MLDGAARTPRRADSARVASGIGRWRRRGRPSCPTSRRADAAAGAARRTPRRPPPAGRARARTGSLVPDTPEPERVLQALAAGHGPPAPTPGGRTSCAAGCAHRAGLLDGQRAVRRSAIGARRQPPRPSPHDPLERPERLGAAGPAARWRSTCPPAWREQAARAGRPAPGWRLDRRRRPGRGAAARVAETEPVRTTVDQLVRLGEPHLLLRLRRRGCCAWVRSWSPGRTACLRCVDAHLAETDPRRPLVVEQYSCADTARPVPEPCDPALLALALGWAVRDLVTWADGGGAVALVDDACRSPPGWTCRGARWTPASALRLQLGRRAGRRADRLAGHRGGSPVLASRASPPSRAGAGASTRRSRCAAVPARPPSSRSASSRPPRRSARRSHR